MITKLSMPRLSETTSEGTIVAWHAREGEQVRKGVLLLDVETDKATVEVESPVDGFLRRIFFEKGATVDAQTIIALIADDITEDLPAIEPSSGGEEVEVGEEVRPETGTERVDLGRKKVRLLASPGALRLARENGISLKGIEGTGPAGRITRADVLRATSTSRDVGGTSVADVIPLSKMRRAIAQSTAESKRVAPHGYVQTEVDMSAVIGYRERMSLGTQDSEGLTCSFTDILIKAVATSLRDFPWMNSSLREDRVFIWKEINIGFVVSLEDEGLMVPVVHDADMKSIVEIARITRDLIRKAREKRMTVDDYSGGTFTISNLGMYGVENFIAIINPPQSAILAVGRITKKPVVVNDEIRALPMMQMTLSSDHRIIDGVLSAKFLQKLVTVLREPQVLDRDAGSQIKDSGDDMMGTNK